MTEEVNQSTDPVEAPTPGSQQLALTRTADTPPTRSGIVTIYYDGTSLLAKLPDGSVQPVLLGTAQSYTAANIAAVGHAVNTTGKVAGKIVFDTTNNRYMRSTGSAAASPWRDLIGTNAVTPA